MNKYISSILVGAMAMLTVSCDKSLDITPKDRIILDSVEALELLLNQEFSFGPMEDLTLLTNECLSMWESVPSVMSDRNSLTYADLTYDESVDRAELSTSDSRYTSLYSYINYMNVITENIGDATGDAGQKPRIEAEARLLRAYFHYILVNIYAKQYDAATADTEGGVPYVNNTNSGETKVKISVAQVYENILNDCDDKYIEALRDRHSNNARIDKAFGYAVRAKALFQMKRYAEAAVYARKALEVNSRIDDRSTCMSYETWNLSAEDQSFYFYAAANSRVVPHGMVLSRETSQLFEPGDYVKDFTPGWDEDKGEMFSGLSGTLRYWAFTTQQNQWGVRSEQMYYILGESLIRDGKIRDGLDYIDKVRAKRVDNYTPFTSIYDATPLTEQQAVALIQPAKRIEFIASYDTFFDCKRWNSEPDYRQSITKDLGEYGTYTITPDSPLWVIPFPANATRFNPTLTQNF